MVKSIREAIKFGHTTKVNLVIGFPNEKRLDILKTVLFGLRMAFIGSADLNISIFSPYPGSELFEELRENGTIPSIDDDYFQNLLIQFDFTCTQSVCPNVFQWEIALYRFSGMCMFYVVSNMLFPKRLWNLLKGILGVNVQSKSLFEQRVLDHFNRRKLKKN